MKEIIEKSALLIGRQAGWRRALLTIAAGGLTALGLAPFYILPFVIVGFSTLVLLLDTIDPSKNKLKSAFVTGWQFGFGYFLIGLYWLAFSFFVQAEQFAWMAPFAIAGMPAFLGIFGGAAAALYAVFWRPGMARAFLFAALWMVFEYARGHILTGLPWNLPGQAMASTAAGIQTVAWYGVYGLSLVVVFLSVLPSAFGAPGRFDGRGIFLSVLGFVFIFVIGLGRLSLIPRDDHADIMVRIVQPNIPQTEKINPAFWQRNLEKLIAASSSVPGDVEKVFVIWPENAVPILDEVSEALASIDAALPKNAILVTGAVRREQDPTGDYDYYNAISFIPSTDAGRRAVGFYDKHHLVPFGEYLPMQGFLRAIGLAQLAPYEDGFHKGEGPRTVDLGGPRFAPLICYEAIFPGQLYPRSERPDWLLTVTNDAWFGDTSGPRQHLDQARLRSVESGLPMARSANTGISAMIDGAGRYRARLPLYEAGVIETLLPKPLKSTLYSILGDLFFLIFLLFFAAFAAFSPKRV